MAEEAASLPLNLMIQERRVGDGAALLQRYRNFIDGNDRQIALYITPSDYKPLNSNIQNQRIGEAAGLPITHPCCEIQINPITESLIKLGSHKFSVPRLTSCDEVYQFFHQTVGMPNLEVSNQYDLISYRFPNSFNRLNTLLQIIDNSIHMYASKEIKITQSTPIKADSRENHESPIYLCNINYEQFRRIAEYGYVNIPEVTAEMQDTIFKAWDYPLRSRLTNIIDDEFLSGITLDGLRIIKDIIKRWKEIKGPPIKFTHYFSTYEHLCNYIFRYVYELLILPNQLKILNRIREEIDTSSSTQKK